MAPEYEKRDVVLPYTWVNKRMCLFSKLQGNMCLIPNMCLIVKRKWPHLQNRDALVGTVARVATWQQMSSVVGR